MKVNLFKKFIVFLVLVFFVIPQVAQATLGVGVGVGKIRVDEDLKPGTIYKLPSITVLNTGDVDSYYEVAIEHHEKQPELIPEESWFIFSPREFKLAPGKVQEVKITLNLPINMTPGDYFAYLEARPVKKTPVGTTSVNIAAATKLNFTVVPGSFLSGLYFKLVSFWTVFAPWPQLVLTIIVAILSLFVIKKFINVEIKMAKRHVPKKIMIAFGILFVIGYLFFWIKYFGAV